MTALVVGALTDAIAAEGEDDAAAFESFFGQTLVDADGKTRPVTELNGKKVGIFFSAHWCPPCRTFTPVLIDFYKEVVADDKNFEIVFVSSDRTEEAMTGYMKEAGMPWLALPFGAAHKDALAEKYAVRGIPTLVVVNANGATISRRGRMDVAQKGRDAYAGWSDATN